MTTTQQAPQPHAIVVFAHGSRDPLWKLPVEAVASRVAARVPQALVRCAYLELTTPDLPSVVAEVISKFVATNSMNRQTVRVFPLFFGVGRHAREDLPALMADLQRSYPAWQFELTQSAGEFDAVLDAAAACAAVS